MSTNYIGIVNIILVIAAVGQTKDTVPSAEVKVFQPRGFEVSIPHKDGITLFAFHGKLNEKINGLEDGIWDRNILKAKKGRWTFRDPFTRLYPGDTLYYWTYLIYNGLGYVEDNGVYVVQPCNSTLIVPISSNTAAVAATDNDSSKNCITSATTLNGAPVRCAKELIFEDNFEGNALDADKWTVQRRIPMEPNYEFCMYLNDVDDVLQVSSGHVTIKPKFSEHHFGPQFLKRPLQLGYTCTREFDTEECSITPTPSNSIPPLISAQFSSKGKFSFKYGLIEVKAKMPGALWVFPQLWLEPNVPKYGARQYRSGQMRIAQTRQIGSNMDLVTGLVLNAREPWYSTWLCFNRTSPSLTQDFHTYQMLWAPDVITFSVDAKEYCRIQISNNAQAFRNVRLLDKFLPNRDLLEHGSIWAPFDQEFHVTVGYGIGGDTDFHDVEGKPWRNTEPRAKQRFRRIYINDTTWLTNGAFKVDYIRIYSV